MQVAEFHSFRDGDAAEMTLGGDPRTVVGHTLPGEPFKRHRWSFLINDRLHNRQYLLRAAPDGRRSFILIDEQSSVVASIYPESILSGYGIYNSRRYAIACFGNRFRLARNTHAKRFSCLGLRLTAARSWSSPSKRHLVTQARLTRRRVMYSQHYLAICFAALTVRDRLVRLGDASFNAQRTQTGQATGHVLGLGRAAM
ncbi:MAG: hypothetical protein AAF078_04845 [Planctomycetota bacterium]